MARYTLYAIGTDRPGIVAAVTSVLADRGCNIDDSRMTILHGQFVIMLVVEAPSTLTVGSLEEAFAKVRSDYDLVVGVRSMPEQESLVDIGNVVMVSVHGADRPGIVASVTGRVAELGGNIIDLATRRIDEGSQASYVLLLSVSMPSTLLESVLRNELESVTQSLGVNCVVHAGSTELF